MPIKTNRSDFFIVCQLIWPDPPRDLAGAIPG
jgi:hypothetical protein